MKPILEINDLGKEFPGFELSNVTFSLNPGEILGFVGPNGAGKTTTIKCIMNLLLQSNGCVKLFGIETNRDNPQYRNSIGFVYDECFYWGNLNPIEIGKILKRIYKDWDGKLYRDMLDKLSLPSSKRIATFSKGMKNKYSIAVAFSRDTKLLILDEPTSGLDPVSRSDILALLKEYVKNPTRSVLFSTHVTSDIEKIADRVIVIVEGKIKLNEVTKTLLDRYIFLEGELNSLPADIRSELIIANEFNGSRSTAITSTEFKEIILDNTNSLKIRPANIEDIVVHLVKSLE